MERLEKVAQFGEFELDARTGELRANGNGPVQLAEQPLQILLALLEKPGEMVSREELQRRLWPSNTIVEFEHSISAAMNRLRKTLGDSAENPKYIETLARRGYRWKGPVEWRPADEPRTEAAKRHGFVATEKAESNGFEWRKAASGRLKWRLLAAGSLLLAGFPFLWLLEKGAPPATAKRGWDQKQLTVNTSENPVTGGAISPDGKYLAYTDLYGMRLKLIGSGEVQSAALPEVYKNQQVNWEIGTWLPDASHFYAIAERPLRPSELWIFSIAGGAQQNIATGVDPWGVSPDGSLLAVTKNGNHEVWLMSPNGENPRRLLTSGEGSSIRAVQWAPNGSGVAYVRNIPSNGTNQAQIEFADVATGSAHVLLAGKAIESLSRLEEGLQDMVWLPDGRLIFSGGKPDIHGTSCNFWESRIDVTTMRASTPERMTDWSGFCVNNVSQTADGKKLVFSRSADLLVVYVADFAATNARISEPRRLTDTDDISSPAGWSPDSKSVLIRSNREGSWGLYRRPIEKGTDLPVITGREGISYWTPVTPDGRWILFKEPTGPESGERRLMRVPVDGGAAEELLSGRDFRVACPQHNGDLCVLGELAPDRAQLVFSAFDPCKGRGSEFARYTERNAEEVVWDLSPDGTEVLLHVPLTNEIELVSLKARLIRQLKFKPDLHLQNVTWTADGKGFFAANAIQTGAQLVHMDLRGNSQRLWEVNGSNVFLLGKASPDGRHLAIQTSAGNSNMWMAENF